MADAAVLDDRTYAAQIHKAGADLRQVSFGFRRQLDQMGVGCPGFAIGGFIGSPAQVDTVAGIKLHNTRHRHTDRLTVGVFQSQLVTYLKTGFLRHFLANQGAPVGQVQAIMAIGVIEGH